MSQELTNEVQRTPSEIVRDMTGGAQIFHPETSVTEEKTTETTQTEESKNVPPQPVPRQSTFRPSIGTWWELVDRDPKYIYFIKSVKDDWVVVESFWVDLDSDKRRIRFLGYRIEEMLLEDFVSGLFVELTEREIPFVSLYRSKLIEEKGVFQKKDVFFSDPERPATLVDDIVRAIADEISVDAKHVNRLLESALEGVRNFVTLKNCVSTSPAIPAFFNVLKTPEIGDVIKVVILPLIESICRTIAIQESASVGTRVLNELDDRVDSLRKELVARRQWESGFDVFANGTREDIERLNKRFEKLEKAFEEIPSVDLAAMKDLTPASLVDSRINPQMNEVREQIANLFERCDNIERQRLRDKQKKWTKERVKKEEQAAKIPEKRERQNQAAKTLYERKRREKVGDELLSRGIVAPVPSTPQVKRGRGRPPKTAVPEVKRGRGRPRKI